MTIKAENSEAYLIIKYPCHTRNTAVRVHGIRGVPKSNTIPEPVVPVLETPRVLPYPYGTKRVGMFGELIASS
jgi:hypothetical protein